MQKKTHQNKKKKALLLKEGLFCAEQPLPVIESRLLEGCAFIFLFAGAAFQERFSGFAGGKARCFRAWLLYFPVLMKSFFAYTFKCYNGL